MTNQITQLENELENLEYDLEIAHFQHGIESEEAQDIEQQIKITQDKLKLENLLEGGAA